MKTDFADDAHWVELARTFNVRLPTRATACTTGKMERWLRRLGISLKEYFLLTGYSRLGDFIRLAPEWPLRAWVGILLEWMESGDLLLVRAEIEGKGSGVG